jgi:hypothetical protein
MFHHFLRRLIMFKSIIASIAFAFAIVSTAFAQTTPGGPPEAPSAELAAKIALAKSYLTRDVFKYKAASPMVVFTRTMSPSGKSADFNSTDPCFQGRRDAQFEVDQKNGELIAKVMPRAGFCPIAIYHFDPVTKKAGRSLVDAKTGQEIPDDPNFRFELLD